MELDTGNQGSVEGTLDTQVDGGDQTLDPVANGEVQVDPGEGTYQPFKDGKEKFVVDGQEIELSWEDAKKHFQLAQASYKKMEEAAKIRTSAQSAYKQMMELARSNPEGLLRVLNPNWQSGTAQRPQQDQRAQDQDNPWQSKLEELEGRNQELAQKLEQFEMQQERAALQTELQAAYEKYPALKGDLEKNYFLAEYKKALNAGMDLTVDDVAFHVNQKLAQLKASQVQSAQAKLQQNRQKAPVSSQPAAPGKAKGPESFDDIRRSLGL